MLSKLFWLNQLVNIVLLTSLLSFQLSRITGTVFILKGPREAETDHASKVNIGLNLKVRQLNNGHAQYSGRDLCKFDVQRYWPPPTLISLPLVTNTAGIQVLLISYT